MTSSVRQNFVVGTAGHVDHGKSTLVKALTGIDPDRLAEEKARAMTIDLGFAWLTLPSGREVSIVDVPGHDRFIKNMLAGVGGIDAAMLIVAADEGPMPQTIEHLAILDLLQVDRGLVVLTKADAVDHEWLDLVRDEIRERLAGTVFRHAPLMAVSALTGAGLDHLRTALDDQLAAVPERPTTSRPRLPVDRVFTVAGFGTVVTGTLTDGSLAVGQELHVFPVNRETRVRGLQTHQRKVDRVGPGSRVAVNLGGLTVQEIHRGHVLASPRALVPTQRIDARLRLLDDSPIALVQNDEVDLFVGAAELPVRLTLLDRETLLPGDSGWVQLRSREPIAVLKGDRFIIRRPSPSVTIGGGEIVDPAPARHRRFQPQTLAALETLAAGSADEIVLQLLEQGPREVRALHGETAVGLSAETIDGALAQLIAEGDVRVLGRSRADQPARTDFVVATTVWERLREQMRETVAAFHDAQPLRRGMPKEELKRRLKVQPARLFDNVIWSAVNDDIVADDGQTVRLAKFRITLDATRRGLADRYLAAIVASPYAPPSPAEFGIDAETLGALVDLGEATRVADGVVFGREAFSAIEREVLGMIDEDGSVSLAGFRDHFKTSRKYAQAALEYLDQQQITRRVGDERVRSAGSGGVAPVNHGRSDV